MNIKLFNFFKTVNPSVLNLGITDLHMPDFDGEFLIEELNKRKSLPILIVHTIITDINKVIQLMKKGVYDYIIKPMKAKEFIHRVNNAYEYCQLQNFQEKTEKEREIRTDYQLNRVLWQEESINRNKDKKDFLLFESMRTNFTQGQGIGALISIIQLIQDMSQIEENYYKIDKECMDVISSNIQLLRQIIDVFNEIREIIKDGLQLEFVELNDFYQLLNEVTIRQKKYAIIKQQAIKVFQCKTDESKYKIKIHKEYMKLILQELFLNAFKFSHCDSEIIVMTEITKDQLLISIMNKAESQIPEDNYQIIFEPFYRISKFVYEFYPTYDMGVGLTLVDKVIQQHGGKISAFDIKSHLSESSITLINFQLELPLH